MLCGERYVCTKLTSKTLNLHRLLFFLMECVVYMEAVALIALPFSVLASEPCVSQDEYPVYSNEIRN